MTSLPAQQKALLLEALDADLVLKTTTIPTPGPGQLLIKIKSTALNPVDWKIQRHGAFIESYPAVLGTDVAGDVIQLGEGVTKFEKGDRVVFQGQYKNPYASFQEYTLADEFHAAKIPANITYDQAATLPVGLTCAYTGLYNVSPHGAGVSNPVEPSARGKYMGVPFLLLGGATSVGQFVLQLAKLSGFSPIIATASLKHTDFLKSFGATHVLDRSLSTSSLKAEIAKITSEPIKHVYDSVSLPDTQQTGLEILESGGTLIVVLPPAVTPPSDKTLVATLGVRQLPHNIKPLSALYDKLEEWLADGTIKPNPPQVLSKGLNGVAEGLRKLEQNQVSGTKLVVRPEETTDN